MERNLQEVFHDAEQLPEADRATLAGLLIHSLDPETEVGVEDAWSKEIQRRVAEVRDGSVELVPWEAVRTKLLAIINER